MTVILTIFCVSFFMGVMLIIISPIMIKKNNRCSAKTHGLLTDILETGNSEGPGYVYVYSYDVNGIEYQLKTPTRSPEAHDVGDDCTIWYNTEKPKDAAAYHYGSSKIFTILLIVGIVMVLACVALPVIGYVVSLHG